MLSRWYENSPNVILEAQAMGLPVVTQITAPWRNRLLFELGNASALVSTLRRLALDCELLARLRTNVRPRHTLSRLK